MKIIRPLFAMLALTTGVFAQDNAAKLGLAREAIAAMHADKMFDGMAAHAARIVALREPIVPGLASLPPAPT